MRFLSMSIVSIFLTLYSCHSATEKQLTIIKGYCVNLDEVKSNKKAIKLLDIIEINNQLTTFYFNNSDSSLNFVRIDSNVSNTINKKIHIKKILTKSVIDPQLKWLIVNYDTIFAISSEHKQVYMFNIYDQIIDSFPLYPKNNQDNYVCFSSDFGSMKYSNKKLIVPVSAEASFNKKTNEYFALSGLIIDISSKTITKFGRSSKKRILGSTSYSNPYDYFDIHHNKVFFSSEEDSFLYVYNTKTNRYNRFKAKSKYFENISPYPDSLLFDREAKIKYIVQEPRYSRISFCQNNNYIFRIAKHRSIIPKSNGYYKTEYPKSQYSLILLDSNFIQVDEILIDNQYVSDFILPTQRGIILFNKKSDLQKQGLLCLDLFKLK
jgi:hypothetical protein